MAVGRFSDTNLVVGAAIAGGTTWSSAWPLANLLTDEDYVGSPALCLDAADRDQSWFELVFEEPKLLRLVALFFHTLTLNARFRLTASTLEDVGYAAPVLATDWDWVFPSLYDPEDLDFGVENFWAGTVTEAELDLFKRHLWAPVPETLAQRLRIEIDDQANPDGVFYIGGAFATAGFSPEINFDRGRELSAMPRDLVDEAPSGRIFAEERAPRRELSINYSMLTDPEARRFVDAAMRARTTRTVVFVPDLDDPAALMREAFPALFSKLPTARISWPGLAASSMSLKEILA